MPQTAKPPPVRSSAPANAKHTHAYTKLSIYAGSSHHSYREVQMAHQVLGGGGWLVYIRSWQTLAGLAAVPGLREINTHFYMNSERSGHVRCARVCVCVGHAVILNGYNFLIPRPVF